ncbi:MAG: YgfZ/GcvT domain-containing protein [Nitrincola lacisaponensis]|uniref:CAF17-like 4Fe-4S cluster assembly/insertion protein YgfZ n=1 Tax=Nitrincola lacisaponensis TaxID=267850 RepID=UPI00391AC4A2
MQSPWQSLTLPAQFELTAEGITGPFNPDTASCLYTPLLHQQMLKVTGTDAMTFLQGQLSCDLRDVIREGSRLGAHCNIKGHMISLFRVIAQNEQCFWLRTHQGLAEKALAQLKKYIIFSKATASLDTQRCGIGFQGPGAAEVICQFTGLSAEQIPETPSATCVSGHWILCCISPGRYELWGEADELKPHLALLQSDSAHPMPLQQWLLGDIQAGIPDLRPETSEAFIPQMTNLQVFEGVSFRKGCYTGQEIVTRLQHRGQLKRPMYRVRVRCDERPLAGMSLHCDDKENVGQVVLAADTAETGVFELLAVILKERAEKDRVWLANHCPVEHLELPYTLDPRLFESKR